MDIRKHLIFLKGDDRTAQITSCRYAEGKWHVLFAGSQKTYEYRYPLLVLLD
jgi:hypothetical protein